MFSASLRSAVLSDAVKLPHTRPHFEVSAGTQAAGVVASAGSGGLLRVVNASTLEVRDVLATNVSAHGNGGGCFLSNITTVTMIDTLFTGASSGRDGGCVFIAAVTTTTVMSSACVHSLSQRNGGGLAVVADHGSDARVRLVDCVVSHCTASGSGGGVSLRWASGELSVVIRDTSINGNTCLHSGGGVAMIPAVESLEGSKLGRLEVRAVHRRAAHPTLPRMPL